MELSTRARYGARLMLDLALHYGEGPVPLKDIAQRQEVSEKSKKIHPEGSVTLTARFKNINELQ